MGLSDRVLTIAVTATLTSAVWVVIGSFYLGEIDDAPAPELAEAPTAAERAPDPRAREVPAPEALLIPVARVPPEQLADTFADERSGGRHEAIDIMAPAGTPVLAAADGKLEKLFSSEEGGMTIYVRSADRRMLHYYAHLRSYAPGLKEGQEIARGQRLGEVGSTGNANPAAPHLHFAVMRIAPDAPWWETATAIDPYPLLVRNVNQ